MAGPTLTFHALVLEDNIVLANHSVSRDVIYSGDEAMRVTSDHRSKETMFGSQVEGEDMQWHFRSWRRGCHVIRIDTAKKVFPREVVLGCAGANGRFLKSSPTRSKSNRAKDQAQLVSPTS